MRPSPYLDKVLGRQHPESDLLCVKCGAKRFGTRHVKATPALKLWHWTLIAATPEHLRYTCGNCGYQFTASVGTYTVKSPG